ncbi:ABC transporter ATP-binding protein [Lacrimispora sp.]|uniref:ABC transporter ATP-binding protein n=1 Tax=Lacrimispora sp. TaxID=2719234 RepID=UPI0028A85EA2|nr:ABC transporter ATP-binding protein [Lacrimispora sp.]
MYEPVIEVKNLSKTYNNSKFCVLERISFTMGKGGLNAIVGESGSGKSTLLNILFGLTEYEEGICKINGTILQDLNIKDRQKFRHNYLGYVPQDYGLIEEWSVYDNITLPFMFYKNNFSKSESHIKDILNSIHLDKSDYVHRKVSLLSGGEKQRVAIARALITKPEILIADELTSALDYKLSMDILSLLQELCNAGYTIVFSTHDDNLLKHCDKIIYLKNGKIYNSYT